MTKLETTLLRFSHSAMWHVLVALAFFFLAAAGPACAATDSFVVSTTTGQLRGIPRAGGGAQFLGIPYAAPPIGDLRWREPVPAHPWNGIRNASAYGAPCTQPDLGEWNRHDAAISQEDCLYLNVDVPEWPVKHPLPVMFWIHGGANEGGSGTGALYNDGSLSSHGVVVVTINYRLGIFGFLAHPELTRESPHHASGNYGLMDQILALKWVHQNIAEFGGDPGNVTVFGQSAGAMDIGMLTASGQARGLFQKAIEESGTPFAPPLSSLSQAEQQGEKAAAALHLPAAESPDGAEAIAAMRKIPALDLLTKQGPLVRQWPGIGPDIDGWVLTRSPAAVFAAGDEAPVPLIFGTTTREFGSSASPGQLRAIIDRAAGPLAPRALALYSLTKNGSGMADPKYGTAADQWSADSLFRCPAVVEGIWHTAAHHAVYEYELDHAIPGQPFAVHSSELPYVFGYFPKTGNISGNFSATDSSLANLFQTYWTNFAKTGNPNSDHLPRWPEFGRSRDFIQFLENGSVAEGKSLRAAQSDLFEELLEERSKGAE